MVLEAERKLGTAYIWGGDGLDEYGLDCSGFACMVLDAMRMVLPDIYDGQRRTAAGIMNYYRQRGAPVITDASKLTPGCLVFFRKGTTGRIYHVQIHTYGFESAFIEGAFSEKRRKVWHGPRGLESTSRGSGASGLDTVGESLSRGAGVTPCTSGVHGRQTEFQAVDPIALMF